METIVDDEWEAFLNDDVVKPHISNNSHSDSLMKEKTPSSVFPKCDEFQPQPKCFF